VLYFSFTKRTITVHIISVEVAAVKYLGTLPEDLPKIGSPR